MCCWCRRAMCWHRACRPLLLLLCVAALLSLCVPHAPLNGLLLTQEAQRERLLADNQARLEDSERFLHQYRQAMRSGNATSPHHPTEESGDGKVSPRDVGVTVLTMKRGGHMENGYVFPSTRYLTQSVASLLAQVSSTSRSMSYSLAVCNVDEHPEAVEEASSLEDIVPVWRRFGPASSEPGTSLVGMWEKYKMDYVYCLRRTLAQGVRFALLVEDDAVAHVQLFDVLEHVLSSVVEAPRARPVAYVKLYHPQRLLGYISLEVERLVELVSLGLTLGALLTWLSLAPGGSCRLTASRALLKYWSGQPTGQPTAGQPQTHNPAEAPSSSSLPHTKWLLLWAWWTMVVVVLALAVGRVNLVELRRLSAQLYQVTPTPSCCTPAVLYTQRGGHRLANFLLNVTCSAKRSIDMRMDDFREMTGERGLLVQPSLFQHIGLVSSLRNKEVNPLIIP